MLEATGTVTALNSVDVRPQIAQRRSPRCTSAKASSSRPASCCSRSTRAPTRPTSPRRRRSSQKDQAALADAQRQLARSRELLAQNFISQGAVDTNQTLVDVAAGGGRADRAAIDAARVGLGYSRIVAPQRGPRRRDQRLPRQLRCRPSGTTLVTITQLDPIAVAFSLPQRDLADVLAALRGGGARGAARRCPTAARPLDRAAAVRRQRGRRGLRHGARSRPMFDNSDQRLWPGAFVNVAADGAHAEGRGRDAAGGDRAGRARQDRVRRRAPTTRWRSGRSRCCMRPAPTRWSAASSRGERVVVDGRQNLRPGSRVRRARRPTARGRRARAGAARRPRRRRRRRARRRPRRRSHEPVRTLHPPAGDDGAAERGDRARRRDRLRAASRSRRCRATTRRSSTSSPRCRARSPETMATSVALPLEKQFQTIPGLNVISSTSTLGSTSVTLEFDEGRDIDAAAVDVQAALLRAQRSLPQEMTVPPSYRKVNPADAPVLFIALTSPSLTPVGPERLRRAPDLADAVDARRRGAGQRSTARSASRCACACMPDALAARNISLDELTAALRAANANTPVGTLDGAAQTLTLQANRQLRNAAEFADLIVASRGGNPVRLRDVAAGRGQLRDGARPAASFNGETLDHAGGAAPARRQHRQGGRCDARRDARASARSCRSRCSITPVNDRSVSIRDALHDVTLTMMGTIALVVLVIFLFLRRFVATVIPTLSLPVSLIGAIALLWGARLQPGQHLAARPDAGGRPGGRRRDRDAREHHAPRRGGHGAVRGGAAGLARGRLHHHLDLDLAGRGVHPDLLHAGRDRPAVPRVRGGRRRWPSSSRRSSR